jgi:hypothetical protein
MTSGGAVRFWSWLEPAETQPSAATARNESHAPTSNATAGSTMARISTVRPIRVLSRVSRHSS